MCSAIHLAWKEFTKRLSSTNVYCYITVTLFWQKMLASYQLARKEKNVLNQALNSRFSSVFWGASNYNSFCFYLFRYKSVAINGVLCKEKCHEWDQTDQIIPWSPCWQGEVSACFSPYTIPTAKYYYYYYHNLFFLLLSASMWQDAEYI